MPRPYPSLRTDGNGPTQHWRAPGGQRNRAILLTGCAMTGPGRASYKNVPVGGRECGSYGMKSDSENLVTTLVGGGGQGGKSSGRRNKVHCRTGHRVLTRDASSVHLWRTPTTARPQRESSPKKNRTATFKRASGGHDEAARRTEGQKDKRTTER